MVEGERALASSKSILTIFSDSPFHLEAREDALMLKKEVSPTVATALASSVLPVPGGPNRSTPFQGFLRPVKYYGIISGRKIASLSTYFVLCRDATY
jgi:hypothetical protein